MPDAVKGLNAKKEYDEAIALARNPPNYHVYNYVLPKNPKEFYERALEIALKNPQLDVQAAEEPAEKLIYIYAEAAKIDIYADFGPHDIA